MGFEKWNPLGELVSLQDRMNKLLKDALSDAALTNDRSGVTWSPPVDFFETDDSFYVVAELPGMQSEDIDVQIDDNSLLLSGTRGEGDKKEREYFRKERFHGSFQRKFSLPAEVRMDSIDAKFKHGVLEIKLPKSAQAGGKSLKVQIK